MPAHKALSHHQQAHAAELYREGKSRRQVAAALKSSEMAVRTALREQGVPLRPRARASAESNRSRAGHYRKNQLVTSVFHLARSPSLVAHIRTQAVVAKQQQAA